MTPDDAEPVAPASIAATEPVDGVASASPEPSDDRASRRGALRDLAAMIGREVFY